jgi:hypothetical protein
MLAHAFLAVATAIERDHTTTPAGMIDLTVTSTSSGACSTPSNAATADAGHNDHDLRL